MKGLVELNATNQLYINEVAGCNDNGVNPQQGEKGIWRENSNGE